jgi:hypothetical protein
MARIRKFPCHIEFWTTEEQAAAFDALAQSQLLNRSDFYRLAFDSYLRSIGALPAPQPITPRANGHRSEVAGHANA